MNVEVPHDVLHAAMEDAAAFYRHQLMGPEAGGPRQYLRDRGFGELLSADTVWTVGHAPAGWTSLRDHLHQRGYADEVLERAGLVVRTRRDTLIDRFRDRITFGIRDPTGRLCGLTARKAPGAPHQVPKYLNSPTTLIYRKSELLFGLGEAGSGEGTTWITEGPLDAIAIAAGGGVAARQVSSLALCGSQLTDAQVGVITSSGTRNVVLALDPDGPGREALLPACRLLGRHEIEVYASYSNEGDPAQLFYAHGAEGVRGLLSATQPALDAIVDQLIDAWPTRGKGAEADLCCLRSAARKLMTIPCVDVAAACRALDRRLALETTVVTHELAAAAGRQSPTELPRLADTRAGHIKQRHGAPR